MSNNYFTNDSYNIRPTYTEKEGIKAKDIKEVAKIALVPGYAIKKGYDYFKGKASANQKAIDDARNKKAEEMKAQKTLSEPKTTMSRTKTGVGKKEEKKAMMKTKGKLVKRDKKIVLPKKKQIHHIYQKAKK